MVAIKEVRNSGMVVATLTRVAPITMVGMFNRLAKERLASVNQSAPLIINRRPRIKKIAGSNID